MGIDLTRATWRKSSRSSSQGNCVEAASDGRTVAVRDSKNPTGPAIPFAATSWAAFIDGIKDDAFNR